MKNYYLGLDFHEGMLHKMERNFLFILPKYQHI